MNLAENYASILIVIKLNVQLVVLIFMLIGQHRQTMFTTKNKCNMSDMNLSTQVPGDGAVI